MANFFVLNIRWFIIVFVNHILCTLQSGGMSCHQNEHGEFELLLWFLCNIHKSGDLCCMSCVSPLVFVRLHMLLISMLMGFLYVFWGKGINKTCAIQL